MPYFVSPHDPDAQDIVGVGDDLSTHSLWTAYTQGIFPWPIDGYPLLWFCPRRRAVLDFDRLHVGRRLARLRRSSEYTFTIDQAFKQVLTACQTMSRPAQDGTWITDPLHRAYLEFHQAGYAHSIEAWDRSGTLVGGLYGVSVNGTFSGESMFHSAPNASKLALLFLMDYLHARGLDWIDIQVTTPHLAALGAHEISRSLFLDRLAAEHARGLKLFK